MSSLCQGIEVGGKMKNNPVVDSLVWKVVPPWAQCQEKLRCGGEKLERKMSSQTPNASDHPSFLQIPKFTAPREIGKADGSGEGEGDNLKAICFAVAKIKLKGNILYLHSK